MSDVFDVDALLDAAENFKARIGGQELEFRRYGDMTAAERKLVTPLIEAREMLFREAGKMMRSEKDDMERSLISINEEVHANQVETLKAACTGTAAAQKKLDTLPMDVVSALYDAYKARTELGEASPSPSN